MGGPAIGSISTPGTKNGWFGGCSLVYATSIEDDSSCRKSIKKAKDELAQTTIQGILVDVEQQPK